MAAIMFHFHLHTLLVNPIGIVNSACALAGDAETLWLQCIDVSIGRRYFGGPVHFALNYIDLH